jgi:hypothetical protein
MPAAAGLFWLLFWAEPEKQLVRRGETRRFCRSSFEDNNSETKPKPRGCAPRRRLTFLLRGKKVSKEARPAVSARPRRVPCAPQTLRGPAKTHCAQTFAGLFPASSTPLRRQQRGKIRKGDFDFPAAPAFAPHRRLPEQPPPRADGATEDAPPAAPHDRKPLTVATRCRRQRGKTLSKLLNQTPRVFATFPAPDNAPDRAGSWPEESPAPAGRRDSG